MSLANHNLGLISVCFKNRLRIQPQMFPDMQKSQIAQNVTKQVCAPSIGYNKVWTDGCMDLGAGPWLGLASCPEK